MKLLIKLLSILFIVLSIGCMTIEDKRELYIRMKNSEIGKPFYTHEIELKGMREEKISVGLVEFIEEGIEGNECGIAWTVDTTEKGEYNHPNGMVFQIEGYKLSWRFVGNPDNCFTEYAWWGPW